MYNNPPWYFFSFYYLLFFFFFVFHFQIFSFISFVFSCHLLKQLSTKYSRIFPKMKYFSSLSHSLSRYTLLHPLPNSFPEAMIIKSLFCSPIQFSFFFSFPFRGSFSSRKENFHVVLFYYYYFFCGGGAAKFSFSLLFFI